MDVRDRYRDIPDGAEVIGDQVLSVIYRKGQPHDCNAECRRKDHVFEHVFDPRKKIPVLGLPDGRVEI